MITRTIFKCSYYYHYQHLDSFKRILLSSPS